jgi:hypothetical protein
MMMREVWLTWLAATAVQSQQNFNASVFYNTSPKAIDNSQWTVAVVPAILHPESPLLNNTETTALQKRKTIDVVIAAGIAIGSLISAGKAASDFIAAKIKEQSDRNSCTFIHGTIHDGQTYLEYAYHATTTGKNCDTTAILKTIQNAVQKCADALHRAGSVMGCCNFSHGGTWTGHLQLSADPKNDPAAWAGCPR